MIKVENKSKEEIAKIGRKVGEPFAKEEGYLAYWEKKVKPAMGAVPHGTARREKLKRDFRFIRLPTARVD